MLSKDLIILINIYLNLLVMSISTFTIKLNPIVAQHYLFIINFQHKLMFSTYFEDTFC